MYITFKGKSLFIPCYNCDYSMIAFNAYGNKIIKTIKGLFCYILLDLFVAVVEANFSFPGVVIMLQISIFWYSKVGSAGRGKMSILKAKPKPKDKQKIKGKQVNKYIGKKVMLNWGCYPSKYLNMEFVDI